MSIEAFALVALAEVLVSTAFNLVVVSDNKKLVDEAFAYSPRIRMMAPAMRQARMTSCKTTG